MFETTKSHWKAPASWDDNAPPEAKRVETVRLGSETMDHVLQKLADLLKTCNSEDMLSIQAPAALLPR